MIRCKTLLYFFNIFYNNYFVLGLNMKKYILTVKQTLLQTIALMNQFFLFYFYTTV